MASKLGRFGIKLLCALLCWALVVAPCIYKVKTYFAPSYDNDAVVCLQQGSTVDTVPTYKLSLPPVVVANSVDSDNNVDDIQNVATSDKALLGLEECVNTAKSPSKPAVSVIQTPPQSDTVTPTKPEEKNVTYKLLTQPDGTSFVYYDQTWSAYANYSYGYNTLGSHGCGPTSMAMVITNLAGTTVSPKYMADWSVNNGFYVRGRGTAYGIFPAAAAAYGIKYSTISCYDKAAVVSALQSGKLLITVVGYGDFTNGRHFLLLRGITSDGKILVADSGSYDNCLQEWDFNKVISQVANSYFWVFER